MAQSFPQAGPEGFAPAVMYHDTVSRDPLAILPPGAQDRLRALRQRSKDLHALTIPFEQRHTLGTQKVEAEARLKKLQEPRALGGFNLSNDDDRVVNVERQIAKLSDELARLNALDVERSAEWTRASRLVTKVENWLKDGRPSGTILEDADVDPQLLKGETIVAAIERYRRRARELGADLHRIRSAPFPSSYAKQRMREEIEQLAERGRPNVGDLIEHDRKIGWPTQSARSQVYNTEVPSVAFAELPDAAALFAWLHREALIKKLDAEIDAEADDAAALSQADREKREAETLADLLAVELDESALVWRALSERLPVEHRADCSPQAILQVRLVTAPRAEVSGTTPGFSFGFSP